MPRIGIGPKDLVHEARFPFMKALASNEALSIRVAAVADAAALLEIYRPYVEDTAVSFETSVPAVEEFAARIQKALTRWQWLVAEIDGEPVGYAYASSHRDRAAYRWSTEVSAYVAARFQRQGIGRLLYERLLEDVARKGLCNAYAGVTMPNDASVGLHCHLGFETVGVFRSVGRKFGKWHDVMWLQRKLLDAPPPEAQ